MVEHEHIERLVVEEAKFRSFVFARDSDFMSRIRDICLQIVILKTFACQTELSELTRGNLNITSKKLF